MAEDVQKCGSWQYVRRDTNANENNKNVVGTMRKNVMA